MKHSASREFFAYWDGARASEAAPERGDLEPEAVRHLLGDIFVLSYDRAAGFPFRVAGTRLCALLGKDAKGARFADYFTRASRREFEDVVGIVAEETLPTIGGIAAEGADGTTIHLELLLLPFSTRSHSPLSLTGLIVPLGRDDAHAYAPLKNFTLTSWRYAGEAQKWRGPRAARKWSVMRGFTVYEGLR
ncbi:MAG: PAS domain-containing protein [Rhizobiales bacterium]|nr:PAS domain-containing protein [Hyphomicrobiales bacterium]